VGCHPGIYRVRITKNGSNGQEMLPARYNDQSRLGIEVGPGMKGRTTFSLTRAR
jgi:hypothetical protein